MNRLHEHAGEDQKDRELIQGALGGDKKSLEALVREHQSWIFNISLSMTGDFHRAEDVTQEALIRIITGLASYNPLKASFRTWMYRIVINHILNMKESRREAFFRSIELREGAGPSISGHPDTRKSSRPGYSLIREEVKHACVSCMLLCLTRRERIVFVLGSVFNVPDGPGADICGISKANFRKILSRTRAKLHSFFTTNCSLLDENNSCKCEEQREHMARAGIISGEIRWNGRESFGTIKDVAGSVADTIEDSYYEFLALFNQQPFFKGPDMTEWLRSMLKRDEFGEFFSTDYKGEDHVQ